MKSIVFSAILGLLCNHLVAQENFYYTFNNEKIFLDVVSGQYYVEYDTPNSLTETNYPGEKFRENIFKVTDTLELSVYGESYRVTPLYKIAPLSEENSTMEIGVFSEIVLEYKDNVNENQRQQITSQYDLTISEETSSLIVYKVTGNALNIANNICETGLVKYCHPNFICYAEPHSIPNDPYFNRQFYLHNTGQIFVDGHGGTVDADIDAPEAWDITKDNSNVVIAVIDHGVSNNHPDLPLARQIIIPGCNLDPLPGQNPNDPSPTFNRSHTAHGNACAGIVAASHNNEGIAGVAPNCKIMPVKVRFGNNWGNSPAEVASAIKFAADNGADIISNSWGYQSPYPNFLPVIVQEIDNAIDNDVIVIFSTGNQYNQKSIGVRNLASFPSIASIEELISVGASNRLDEVPFYSGVSPDLVAPSHNDPCDDVNENPEVFTMDNPGSDGYNPVWDLAPGDNCDDVPESNGQYNPSVGSNNNYAAYTARFGGTSASAPQVAGVAALMMSVNPCLGPASVKDILINSTDVIGNYSQSTNVFNGLPMSIPAGHGRLNAHKAVQLAQQYHSPGYDVYMKDVPEDMGYPGSYAFNWDYCYSPDIWVRNQPDGLNSELETIHQDPEYSSTHTQAYVYVRVRNKGCESIPASGPANLELFWTYFSTSSSWQQNFSPPNGGVIGNMALPEIPAGGSIILKFDWDLPATFNTHTACLLARINSIDDPITPYSNNLAGETYYNNNIAMRNLTIVSKKKTLADGTELAPGQIVTIGDPNPDDGLGSVSDFNFKAIEYNGLALLEYAEVNVTVDQSFWDIVGNSPSATFQGIEIVNDNTLRVIEAENAYIRNLTFEPGERIEIYPSFSFYADSPLEEETEFYFHLTEERSDGTGEPGPYLGSANFRILKPAREAFEADAGPDQEIYEGEEAQLKARAISEPASYNWYYNLNQDTLVASSQDTSLILSSTSQYLLEVIADSDGAKAYDSLNISVKRSWIKSISPNPATSYTDIVYSLDSTVGSASIVLTHINTSATHTYNLVVNQTILHINNLSSLNTGLYSVKLMANGILKEERLLLIQ